MKAITPEDFEIILSLIDWNNLEAVHRVQAIAADDSTLVNLYTRYEQKHKSTIPPDSA